MRRGVMVHAVHAVYAVEENASVLRCEMRYNGLKNRREVARKGRDYTDKLANANEGWSVLVVGSA